MSWLVDNLSRTLHRSMDLRLARQNLISSNLANVDTPGYLPRDLDFHATLEAVLEGAGEAPSPEVFTDPTVTPGADGNGVDLDREMARLASNGLMYSASVRIHGRRVRLLKAAITEGEK